MIGFRFAVFEGFFEQDNLAANLAGTIIQLHLGFTLLVYPVPKWIGRQYRDRRKSERNHAKRKNIFPHKELPK
jgi:hypothetical protein